MPAASVNNAVQAPIEKVYGGCGVYGHRGPYGGCRADGQASGRRYRR
ncbi:GCG_CRPN prefix-to-repeats domain-containing protein [Methylocystis sp.]